MKIYTTKKYDLFTFFPGNRSLREDRINKLSAAVLADNRLHENPIKVNEKMQVIDGQHRLEVARRNLLELSYFISEGEGVQQMIDDNNFRWNWGTSDFLDLYITQGKEDYVILKQFCDKYNMSVTLAMFLMAGKDTATTHHSARVGSLLYNFKLGRYKVENLKQAIAVADYLSSVKPYLDGTVYKDRDFIQALRVACNKVGSKAVLNKFQNQKEKFRRQPSYRDYVRAMEDLLNYRAKIEVRLY